MVFRSAAMATVVVLSAASVFANTSDTNLQVFKDVQEQVNRSAYFTIFDNVEAAIQDDGVVILSGRVTNPFKKREFAKRAARVDGVTHVVDEIAVLPVSRLDDQLRYQAARAIYGHADFRHYPRLHPPVHIVVERGHVTLNGVVNSEDGQSAGTRADRPAGRVLDYQ